MIFDEGVNRDSLILLYYWSFDRVNNEEEQEELAKMEG